MSGIYHLTVGDDEFSDIVASHTLKWYAFCKKFRSLSSDKLFKMNVYTLLRIRCPSLKQYGRNLVKTKRSRTVFRKIICPGHVIGVLHYIAVWKGSVEFHYGRNKYAFSYNWVHKRGGYTCIKIGNAISEAAAEGVSDITKYDFVFALHDAEHCDCAGGK